MGAVAIPPRESPLELGRDGSTRWVIPEYLCIPSGNKQGFFRSCADQIKLSIHLRFQVVDCYPLALAVHLLFGPCWPLPELLNEWLRQDLCRIQSTFRSPQYRARVKESFSCDQERGVPPKDRSLLPVSGPAGGLICRAMPRSDNSSLPRRMDCEKQRPLRGQLSKTIWRQNSRRLRKLQVRIAASKARLCHMPHSCVVLQGKALSSSYFQDIHVRYMGGEFH